MDESAPMYTKAAGLHPSQTAKWCKHVLNKIYDAVDHIVHCILWARSSVCDKRPAANNSHKKKNGNILFNFSGFIRYSDLDKCEKLIY